VKKFKVKPSPWTATLTWWEGLCFFDVKKADQRQSEIKDLAKASSIEKTNPSSYRKGGPSSNCVGVIYENKNMVMGPDGARHQE
jgi:hypothetical protein